MLFSVLNGLLLRFERVVVRDIAILSNLIIVLLVELVCLPWALYDLRFFFLFALYGYLFLLNLLLYWFRVDSGIADLFTRLQIRLTEGTKRARLWRGWVWYLYDLWCAHLW